MWYQFWRRGERLFLWITAVHHCEQSEFSCWSQRWMTQVSNFFLCHLLTMICLWCWQSLQMHCGNGQGLILVLEFYCVIPDIFSISGEGLLWEVEMWNIYLDIFFWLSCVLEPASVLQDLMAFAHLLFWHFENFINVSSWFCLDSVRSYGLCLHLQVQCSHCITTFLKFLL